MSELREAAECIIHYNGRDEVEPSLKDTPKRFEKFWTTWPTYGDFPRKKLTTFDSEGMSEMVLVRDIPVYSMCEHHILPFFGKAHVAYIPDKRIVGLSKIPRVVKHYSSRLQNQERITQEIAQYLQDNLEPKGVAVVIECRHLCMEMRGVECGGANTRTTKLVGAFFEHHKVRDEFMASIKG